jgi:DNA-binding response OmpR family regulator
MATKILVVDDEPDIVELVTYSFQEAGYEVVTARSGMEALRQARACLPDLILLDLMLPELDGMAVCEILRRLPSTARIPVIMLTAWNTDDARRLGLAAGASEYLTKPFSPRELIACADTVLQRCHGQEHESADHSQNDEDVNKI